jgi:hypothetical protein
MRFAEVIVRVDMDEQLGQITAGTPRWSQPTR